MGENVTRRLIPITLLLVRVNRFCAGRQCCDEYLMVVTGDIYDEIGK